MRRDLKKVSPNDCINAAITYVHLPGVSATPGLFTGVATESRTVATKDLTQSIGQPNEYVSYDETLHLIPPRSHTFCSIYFLVPKIALSLLT